MFHMTLRVAKPCTTQTRILKIRIPQPVFIFFKQNIVKSNVTKIYLLDGKNTVSFYCSFIGDKTPSFKLYKLKLIFRINILKVVIHFHLLRTVRKSCFGLRLLVNEIQLLFANVKLMGIRTYKISAQEPIIIISFLCLLFKKIFCYCQNITKIYTYFLILCFKIFAHTKVR